MVNIDKKDILNKMKRVLDNREYSYTDYALNKIIDEWADKKSNLLNLLARHPQYVDGKYYVSGKAEFERKLDNENRCKVDHFKSYIQGVYYAKYNNGLCGEILWKLKNIEFQFVGVDDTQIQQINEMIKAVNPSFKGIKNGQKMSRAVNAICIALGIDKDELYNKEFAKYADAVNPLTVEYPTFLSVNPIDYLLMSNGNSWHSCHYIGNYPYDAGCYSSGTISYMLDTDSMIAYNLTDFDEGEDAELKRKKNRQVFAYNNGTLLQSRMYPQGEDGNVSLYNNMRFLVQQVIAECEGKPNLWKGKIGASTDNGRSWINTAYGSTHYCDYKYFSDPNITQLKGFDDYGVLGIGAKPICIECGDRHCDNENINHCDGSGYECACCGAHISEDDVYYVGDETYCSNCVTYCDNCGEYEVNENVYYVDDTGEAVCEYCLENSGNYFYCEDCGEWHSMDNAVTVTKLGRYGTYTEAVCEDCAENNYYKCEHCDEWYATDLVHEIDGEFICDDCMDDATFDCEECGEIHLWENRNEYDGKYYCDDCIDAVIERYEQEEESEVA